MSETADLPPLVRTSIYQKLRSDILSCVLRPGSQIQERQLVERFQVSKSPIRDALLRLEEQNLVEVLPRRGYRVKPISLTDARELYDMRAILERECVLRVIDTAADPAVADLDVYRTPPGEEGLPAWIAYNRRFHLALADLSGNARLARSTRDVIEEFDRFTVMSVLHSGADRLGGFVAEHAALIGAIQRRDRRQAAALIRDHVESSRRRTLEALEGASVVP